MSTSPLLDSVPDSRRAAVAHAIAAAFDDAAPESLAPLSGGMSGALAFKFVVDGGAYVLRIIRERTPLNDPARHFACLRNAADLGIAPPVRWADAETGISIVGFIASQPLHPALWAQPGLFACFGALLRDLHRGPALAHSVSAFDFIAAAVAGLAAAQADQPALLQTYLERLPGLRAALEPHLTLALCHNDLNPGNVLFDGERIWLIDWETAGMADPYFDLAPVILWFAGSAEHESALLRGYFGAEPTPWQLAKLALSKQIIHGAFGVMFLMIGSRGGASAADATFDGALPSFGEARMLLGTGRLQLHVPADSYRFGLINLNHALRFQEEPAFAQAVERLAGA